MYILSRIFKGVKLKAYYHAHELAYQQIKSRKQLGWGNAQTLDQLGDQQTHSYLKSMVSVLFDSAQEKSALDLGCGSGTTAFTLTRLGFSVTGIDISETAIEMARDLADKQSLKIQFQTHDILQLEKLNKKFDLIYDSHCLHCIVFEQDRSDVFRGVKNSLNDSGVFILDTMIMSEKCDPIRGYDSLRFDKDYILWHKTKEAIYRGVVEIDGEYWCAQRRIYPLEKVIDEVLHAGFSIVSKKVDSNNEYEPDKLRLVLKL